MTFLFNRFSFFTVLFLAFVVEISAQQVYFTTGFKVSELGSDHATVWTRLCANEKPNPVVHQRLNQVFKHPIDFDENMPIANLEDIVRYELEQKKRPTPNSLQAKGAKR